MGLNLKNTVKVIIPLYGEDEYYQKVSERALCSVLRQTYFPNHIVVSKEETLQEARNKEGLNHNNQWVLFVDADDEIDEYYIEEMMKLASPFVDIIAPTVHRYYEDGRIDVGQEWYSPKDLMTGNWIVIGAMIRTSLFKKLGGFDDYPIYEDWSTFLRAEEAGATIIKSDKAIYKIHVREKSRNNQDANIQASMFLKILNEAKKRRGISV